MKFLPFEKVTYETKLAEEEIIKRLSDLIKPEDVSSLKKFFFGKSEKLYEGVIENNQFTIKVIPTGGRDIIPVIIGDIESYADKTIINLKIRIVKQQIIESGLFYLFMIYFFITALFTNPFGFGFFGSLLLFALAHLYTMFGYNTKTFMAKIDLQQLFEAEEV